MKPIKQWLEELPEPYRTQALENIHYYDLERKCPNLPTAVFLPFDWSSSKQGFDYWNELHEKL